VVIASRNPENMYQTWNGKIGIKFHAGEHTGTVMLNDDLLGRISLANTCGTCCLDLRMCTIQE
jgi:hypothetical protein